MDNSQKILKMLSGFIEAGILTSQDLKKELSSSLKFKKESFAGKLDLVTKKEFEILKKVIEKRFQMQHANFSVLNVSLPGKQGYQRNHLKIRTYLSRKSFMR